MRNDRMSSGRTAYHSRRGVGVNSWRWTSSHHFVGKIYPCLLNYLYIMIFSDNSTGVRTAERKMHNERS